MWIGLEKHVVFSDENLFRFTDGSFHDHKADDEMIGDEAECVVLSPNPKGHYCDDDFYFLCMSDPVQLKGSVT